MGPPRRTPAEPRLSKSRFLSGLQCHRRLHLERYAPGLASEVDAQVRARLEMGIEVGELARGCFPGGALVDSDHLEVGDALSRTAELVSDPTVPAIFEGMFEYDNTVVRVDVLQRVARGALCLIEVKSSTRVRDDHLDDVAIQAYVLSGAGIRPNGSALMLLNTEYLYPGGPLDLNQLFRSQDVTVEVSARQAAIPRRVAEMREVLAASRPPAIEPDHHCHEPHVCPFWMHCTESKPARWIYHLPGGRRTFQELTRLGIQTMDEIPPGFRLSAFQRRVKDDAEWIGPGLRRALAAVRYPAHHLDIETCMPPIPKYPSTRPYQTIPFQWSNHIVAADGTMRHEEYLCSDPKDPREEFALTLLQSIGRQGTICVYSGYEARILRELADALPGLRSQLHEAIQRFWDMLPIIRSHYYHPGFAGSYSIKSVLPGVVPSLGYDDLEIQEGGMASLQYYRMIFEVSDETEKAGMRTALLKYCERDTLAMVELRRALVAKAAMAAA